MSNNIAVMQALAKFIKKSENNGFHGRQFESSAKDILTMFSVLISMPPDESAYLKINFVISHPKLKHMFWVLKRTVSMRWFL